MDMERIHRKSALNRTAELILATHERGEGLLWERYEKQLPLCAFTNNGLNCRRCFQGPCRVSPFGDEPDRGVCGADRDQIVMENLFRTTLEGVLETARSVTLMGKGDGEFPDVSRDLSRKPARQHEVRRLPRDGSQLTHGRTAAGDVRTELQDVPHVQLQCPRAADRRVPGRSVRSAGAAHHLGDGAAGFAASAAGGSGALATASPEVRRT